MQECYMAMGSLTSGEVEVGEGKTKSCAQFSFAADSGQTTRSKWRGPYTLTAGEATHPRMANEAIHIQR